MTIEQYIDSINKRYKLGNATEHTYRSDLQQLLETLVPEIRATNEPKIKVNLQGKMIEQKVPKVQISTPPPVPSCPKS